MPRAVTEMLSSPARVNSSVCQLELALLRVRLHAFERRFYLRMGPLYMQLDEARAQSARMSARFSPAAQAASLAARQRADATASECASALQPLPSDPEKLKRIHHQLAREFHPDLASDQARRTVREKLMTEVNLAFEAGDLRRLEILHGGLTPNDDAARDLAALAQSPAAGLMQRMEYAARQQRDLPTELSGRLRALTMQEDPASASAATPPGTLMARALLDLTNISHSRKLTLPLDVSMGEIHIRAERDLTSQSVLLGDARGNLNIPYGQTVLLRLNSKCTNLSALDMLDAGDLNGLISEWPNFVNLNDELLLPLARFHRIEELRLGQTEITGHVFDAFSSLHELRALILDETAFDDYGMQRLEECVWMQHLDLSFTQVTGPGLRAMRNMTALRELNLYGTGVADEHLTIIDQNPGIRTLNLGLTGVTDGCIRHLEPLQLLESLNLGGTKITDAILEGLARLPKLRELILWETAISPVGAARLRDFPALRYVDVDQTGVTAEALEAFHAARPDVRLPSDIWAEPKE